MRYITSALHRAYQLYRSLALPWISEQFMDIYKANYIWHDYCRQHYNLHYVKGVLYENELHQLILNDDNTFKSFDNNIGEQLLELYKKVSVYNDKMHTTVLDAAEKLQSSDVSSGIKELAKLRLHDDTIESATLDNNQLEIIVLRGKEKLSYKFNIVENSIDAKLLTQLVGSIIWYEELFSNEDETYEYNIMGKLKANPLFPANYESMEFSVSFYDVRIQQIW